MLRVIWTRFEVMAAIAMPLGIMLTASGAPTPHAHPQPGSMAQAASAPRAVQVSFADDVVPILEAKCVACHGGADENGAITIEMELELTSYEKLMKGSEYGSIVEPGNVEDSILWQMIEFGDMPQDGDPLTEDELATIRTWIAEGAENN